MTTTYNNNLALNDNAVGDTGWGPLATTNMSTLLAEAISGYTTQACTGGTDTLTMANGATCVARHMMIEMTTTGGGTLVVPVNEKLYFMYNNTASAITVKVSGQTGVSVPAGKKMVLACNGTDVIDIVNYFSALSAGSITATPISGSTGSFTDLTSSGLLTFTGTVDGTTVITGTSGRKITLDSAGLYGKGTKIGAPTAWLEAAIPATENNTEFMALSWCGLIGIIGASRSSDYPFVNQGTIGVAGYALNDYTALYNSAYAGYFEAHKYSGTVGSTVGIEVDVVSRSGSTLVSVSPYAPYTDGLTAAGWFANGAGFAGATTSSVGIGIVANGASFERGLMFAEDALTAGGEAVVMASGHYLCWYADTGGIGSLVVKIGSLVSTTANGINQFFTDNNILFNNSAGKTQFNVTQVASGVNHIQVASAIAGSSPFIYAKGDSANVGLTLYTKGTGGFSVVSDTAGTPSTQFRVLGAFAATSFIDVYGSTANGPFMQVESGTLTDVSLSIYSKGIGSVQLGTNQGTIQFIVADTGGANKSVRVTGAGDGANANIGAIYTSDGTTRNLIIGSGAQLATSATDGYMMIPSCAGVPTGAPTAAGAGQIPLHYDSTNNKLYAYNGSWRSVTLA
jgi:hypothetical protein